MANVRISIPKTASKGEVVEVKTLISHPMETGFRRALDGNPIPRNILKSFECRYGGKVVFNAEFFPSISANPYLTFYFKAEQSGDIEFIWVDQLGNKTREIRSLSVE